MAAAIEARASESDILDAFYPTALRLVPESVRRLSDPWNPLSRTRGVSPNGLWTALPLPSTVMGTTLAGGVVFTMAASGDGPDVAGRDVISAVLRRGQTRGEAG